MAACLPAFRLSRATMFFQGSKNLLNISRGHQRTMSQILQQEKSPLPPTTPPPHTDDPFSSIQQDLKDVFHGIKMELKSRNKNLNEMVNHYFDGQSKTRAAIIILMAKALNNHVHGCESILLPKQRQVAMVTEMFSTAGMLHDVTCASDGTKITSDVVSNMGEASVLIGDYIICMGNILLASIENNQVYGTVSKILGDQVHGEFVQNNLPANEMRSDGISRYVMSACKKTGSSTANGCKAVAILTGADSSIQEMAYQYGRNVGITFQIAHDSVNSANGSERKTAFRVPSSSHSGLAPKLNVAETDECIEDRRYLARHHCENAIRILEDILDCPEKHALVSIPRVVLNRLEQINRFNTEIH